MAESLEELVVRVRSEAEPEPERLELAVSIARELAETADALVGHFVEECRQAGISWAQIGDRLGVTKQAAQQRFVTKGAGIFDRFTDRARNVLVHAQKEAGSFNHNYLGTEHILLGFYSEPEAIAARVLDKLGVRAEVVRGRLVEVVGAGSDPTTATRPFTPRARKALELAVAEALALNHNYIGTEHQLLGLIALKEGVAFHILKNEGANYPKVRGAVVEFLSELTG